jgi:RNase P subunit RPR2
MSKPYFDWESIEKETRRLRCTKCDNLLMTVVWKPVARQAKKGKRLRIVAVCRFCGKEEGLAFGSPQPRF